MYLGPLVGAQQVLDPSPQTRHPRKEKGGGGVHLRYSQVFRSLNPGSRYMVSGFNKIENFNYLNVAFISYKLTMWD